MLDKDQVAICKVLEVAAAEELIAGFQYQVVAPYLSGFEGAAIAEYFRKTAEDEVRDHFMRLLARMSELGYTPRSLMNFEGLNTLAECKYMAPVVLTDVRALLEQNVKAEDCAIARYENLAVMCGDLDPVTRCMCEAIAKDEWAHRDGLVGFIDDYYSFMDSVRMAIQ